MARDWETEFSDIPEYFPGSSRKIVRHQELVEKMMREDTWDSRPKKYNVNGEEHEFFTVGQLSQALGRAPVTVRKWEREGVIPKAQFGAPSADPRGRRRLYTRAQVEGIVRIAQEEGILAVHQKPISETNFTKRVIELFGQLKGPGQ